MTERVRCQLLHSSAKPPYRATPYASGYDIYACLPNGPVTLSQRPTLVPTGIALEVPHGLDAQLRPRSGLARQGILATYGTLDSDYRGELFISLYATSPDIEYVIHDGDRIAQLVLTKLVEAEFEVAGELSDSERGTGGHGSTGR